MTLQCLRERDLRRVGCEEVACTTVCSTAVSVSGRIGAVEVHVLVSHEATVAVLCLDVLLRD